MPIVYIKPCKVSDIFREKRVVNDIFIKKHDFSQLFNGK